MKSGLAINPQPPDFRGRREASFSGQIAAVFSRFFPIKNRCPARCESGWNFGIIGASEMGSKTGSKSVP